ncbi:MAG: lipoate--protein ligase family protein [Lentisphaeria bacterium]|nr:lipoate--protein ligase family protein [Lentisphaeria bacterium]
MMESWLLWRDTVHDPYFNMSMDEILLEEAPNLGAPLIRTYRWDRPSLSIGCSQTYPESEEARYAIVRRPTGGGNVFHDADLTYTAVIPAGHELAGLNRMDSYRVFHEAMLPMLAALGVAAELKSDETPHVDRATMKCFVSPSRFDIVAETGGKYAGAAQRRTRNGILHQGSIRLSAAGGDWERLNAALLDALETFFHAGFREREIPAAWLDRAETLARTKYETREWNRGAQHQ